MGISERKSQMSDLQDATRQTGDVFFAIMDAEIKSKGEVKIPRRADATEAQVRARVMPDLIWTAELEGSVHSVHSFGTLKAQL